MADYAYFCDAIRQETAMILIADSGSTKTDWCVSDGGRQLERISTQGINPFHQDEGEIMNILEGELLPHVDGCEPRAIYFYGSGCRDEFTAAFETLLGRLFPSVTVIEARGDLLGAARAVCGRHEGMACILGTGSNSCLYDGHGIVANTPPLGYVLGDEGSGAVLGRNLLNAMYKGRLSQALRDRFEAETGLDAAEIVRRVYREPLPNRFLASMSLFIRRHISNVELRSLVIENFRAFFRNNVAAYGRKDLSAGVVGSVGYFYAAELSEAAGAEGVKLGEVVRSPIDGLVRYHS